MYCVLACDGVWDVCTAQEVADFGRPKLQKGDSPQKVTEELVDFAFAKGSTDNITAIVVLLQPIGTDN
jgi:serine/threonine protein phosphatase PrpC